MSQKKIGYISVDAGVCWIGDPCYILDGKPPKPLDDWSSFCESLGGEHPTMHSFNHRNGTEGLGVCVSTGIGDGVYPVFATVKEVEGWGERVTSVTINFMDNA